MSDEQRAELAALKAEIEAQLERHERMPVPRILVPVRPPPRPRGRYGVSMPLSTLGLTFVQRFSSKRRARAVINHNSRIGISCQLRRWRKPDLLPSPTAEDLRYLAQYEDDQDPEP